MAQTCRSKDGLHRAGVTLGERVRGELQREASRRDSGATYNIQWVQRAWMSRQKGWPQEGYVQSFWRNPEISVTQKDKYRLPKVGGKQHVNFHPRRVRRANEADLRWITQAYGQERVALSPQ